jgi:hypothetical protein
VAASPGDSEAMAGKPRYEVVPTGWAQSPLTDRSQAPRQDTEGTPGVACD